MAPRMSGAAFRRVVAVSRGKGQLRVMIRGWGRWYPVENVRIERTGPQLLPEGLTWFLPAGVLARPPTGPAHAAAEQRGERSPTTNGARTRHH
jgi:hypothetical protein